MANPNTRALAPCGFKARTRPSLRRSGRAVATIVRMEGGRLVPHGDAALHLSKAVQIDAAAGEVRIVFRLTDVDLTTEERLMLDGAAETGRLATLDRIPVASTRLDLPLTLPAGMHQREPNAALVAELAADLAAQLPALIAAALGLPAEDAPTA